MPMADDPNERLRLAEEKIAALTVVVGTLYRALDLDGELIAKLQEILAEEMPDGFRSLVLDLLKIAEGDASV